MVKKNKTETLIPNDVFLVELSKTRDKLFPTGEFWNRGVHYNTNVISNTDSAGGTVIPRIKYMPVTRATLTLFH